ncbi:MAG: hypothetical protein KC933_12450 [Myxococcales bacterium]|nr:hypothetical protein [Myxococcales bacterium]MCB9645195.1 hypothetical protein [Deltaproteobacteria bacterium]
MKKLLKFLHELGTVGLMGAAAAQLIYATHAADLGPAEYAAARQGILLMTKLLLMPSLVLVIVSGLLAMGLHQPFHNADWVWIKALMTPLVFEGTLIAVQGPAQTAAALAARIAEGDLAARETLQGVLRHETGGLWVILVLSTANVLLAVWRPRFRRRRSEAAEKLADRG